MSDGAEFYASDHSDEHLQVRYRPREGDPPFLPLHGRVFLPDETVSIPTHTRIERGGEVVDMRAWFADRPDFEIVA